MYKCEKCKHFDTLTEQNGQPKTKCKLTKRIIDTNKAEHSCKNFNKEFSGVCYCCKYFMGGDSEGLSCAVYFYNVVTPMTEACEKFENAGVCRPRD